MQFFERKKNIFRIYKQKAISFSSIIYGKKHTFFGQKVRGAGLSTISQRSQVKNALKNILHTNKKYLPEKELNVKKYFLDHPHQKSNSAYTQVQDRSAIIG